MVTPTRLLALVVALGASVWSASSPAAAQERSIYDDVKLEVVPETNGVEPFTNELVLLRIRGVYRPLVNIADLVQPALVDFGWTNLTRDISGDAEFDGFPAKFFERTIAVFPEKTGELTIGSFTHRLTVVDGSGYRLLDVKSPPVKLKVAEWKGPGGPKDPNQWWLPSSDVRITDDWSADPNQVARGETVRRTVTIEADGVTAEQLPPPPVMRSAGIISFRGPIDRETRVTESGPVARAIYRWDMRPTTAYPAIVEPVPIAWFDTRSRTLRQAMIPAQRMAWAAVAGHGESAAPNVPDRPAGWMIAGAGGLAFLLGLGVLMVGAGTGSGLPSLPPRALYAMRFSAWRGDAAGFRAAVTRLARDEPERSRVWSRNAAVRGGLAELDRHLFDATAAPSPSLRRLGRAVATARRKAEAAAQPVRSALAPLDGPAARR